MSSKGPFIVLRVIGFLLLVALIIGGGAMVYRAGMAHGISQSPAVATAIAQSAESGQPAPVPPMMYGHGYGYGYPMNGHHAMFFPFGAICGSIFFFFLIIGLMKMVFFGGMRHRGWKGRHHGPWGRHCENGVPPMFEEWHKRAHGEKTEEESKKE